VVVVGVFCAAITYVTLMVIKRTMGLRVSPQEEREGVTMERLAPAPAPPPPLDEDELRRKMGGE
jgi:ammonia channel protein AmtB